MGHARIDIDREDILCYRRFFSGLSCGNKIEKEMEISISKEFGSLDLLKKHHILWNVALNIDEYIVHTIYVNVGFNWILHLNFCIYIYKVVWIRSSKKKNVW